MQLQLVKRVKSGDVSSLSFQAKKGGEISVLGDGGVDGSKAK